MIGPVRVYAYIDGFNLYNGALKNRPVCKWLDLRTMCERLLPTGGTLDWIRYFTARPGSSGDPRQPQKQEIYLRALQGECAPFSLHEGHFRTDTEWLELAGSPPEAPERAKVRVKQEKGSDVNLAIHLISDAAEHELDAAMVITDDFDQAGALRMAKELYGISLIVVSPRRQRKLAKSVGADFYKPLHESLLRECQLPDLAIDHDGHEVHRPATWIETPKMERPPRGTASSLAPEATRACSAKISPTADEILRHRNRLRSVNPARLRSDIDRLFR
jgi:hypothetical protein